MRLTASCALIAAGVLAVVGGCGGGGPADRRASAASGATGAPRVDAAVATTDRVRARGLTRKHPRRYRKVCRRQADQAPAGARTCPPLLPTGRLAVLYSGRLGGREGDPGGFSADLASPSISRVGDTRVQTNGGHWRYDVAWTPSARAIAVDRNVVHPPNATRRSSCHRQRVAGRRMRVCRVVPHEQGGGINGGHIAYVWRDGTTAYVISLHGYRNRTRARAMMRALVNAVAAP
jgi:hypothetical protein